MHRQPLACSLEHVVGSPEDLRASTFKLDPCFSGIDREVCEPFAIPKTAGMHLASGLLKSPFSFAATQLFMERDCL